MINTSIGECYIMKKFLKNYWPYYTASIICLLVILIHCITRGLWLFGNRTFLAGDASAQYIYYMSEIWHKLHEGGSMFFTWNIEMGVDAYMNMAGYLLEPLHIIVWLMPWEQLENTVQLVMVIRFCLMPIAIIYYILHTEHNIIRERRNLIALVMGVCYTCSGIMIFNFIQITWWSVFILFPFLVLSFERFMKYNRWKAYYALLVIMMFFNVYLAYISCLYLILMFLNIDFKDFKDFITKGVRFAVVSVLAVLTGVLAIVPIAAGIFSRSSSYDDVSNVRLKESLATLWQFIDGTYMFSSVENIYDHSPHIYMGMAITLIIFMYIFVPIKLSTKIKRILTGILIGGGFLIAPISYVWHAFVIPNGYYFRFSMVWVFYCMIITIETIPYLSQIRLRHIGIILAVLSAVYIAAFFHKEIYQDAYVYLTMALLISFYTILFVLNRRKSIQYKTFLTILSWVVIVEVIFNAYFVFADHYHVHIANTSFNRFADDLIEYIDDTKGERTMITNVDIDYGLWKNFKTVNGFASASNPGILKMLTMLGLSQHASETGGDCKGGTPLINYIFNVKYGIGLFEGTFSDVKEVNKSGDMKLYEMRHPVYMGYMVNDDILDWNTDESQLFDGQNDFVKKAVGMEPFMKILPRTGTVQVDYGYLNEQDNGDYNFIITDDKSGVMLSYVVPEDMDLYIYSYSSKDYGFRNVKVDGELVYSDYEYRTIGTIHVGEVKKGQVVTVMQILTGYIAQDASFHYQMASFDSDQYEKIYEKLSDNVMEVKEFKDTYVKGEIDVKKDGILMTSIPAKDGFTVYVDGIKTDYKSVNNALIGIPLETGNHVVEFRYITPFFIQGLMCSCVGLLLFIIICVIDKLRSTDNQEEVKGELL